MQGFGPRMRNGGMSTEDRRAAVDTAYRRHADDVYRVAYAICRRSDLAEDATQETFARAFEHWDRFDPARPLAAWLHGIVAHVALDGLRRRRIRDVVGWGSAATSVQQIDVADPDRASGDPEAALTLRATAEGALALLPPRTRAVLVLRHYYGYDYASIAAIVGTSEGNVGSIISRAHAQLRVRLRSEADATPESAQSRPPDPLEVLE